MGNQPLTAEQNSSAVQEYRGPTEGSVRAARAIAEQTSAQICSPGFFTERSIYELALLIDEQTAAPDMLAALLAIREWLLDSNIIDSKEARFWNENFVKANNTALAAIAKATGGQP